MFDETTRRGALKRLGKLCAAAALTGGTYGLLYGRSTTAASGDAAGRPIHFKLENAPDEVVLASSPGPVPPEALVRKAVDRLGGMSRFVSRGDVVAVKPNMAWDRPPQLAANTNPEVVSAVIRLCLEAGASKVHLIDHSINDARRVFVNCGIEAVAKETGAKLFYPAGRDFKEMLIAGRRLDRWKVYTPVIEADKLINMPVAKSHGLSRLTLGMKNWIGAVGGSRGALHQDIHQTIVDLAFFFQPTLVVTDAIRVMLHNGPSGGRPSDVVAKNTVIAGTDQVAVDAAAAPLFDMRPDEVGYIVLGEQQGLGKIDPGPEKLIKIDV